MAKLHHTPFETSPHYAVEVADHVRAWFAQHDAGGAQQSLDAVRNKTRNANNVLDLRPRDAFLLVIQYRRDDIWAAICKSVSHQQRRDWGMGHAIEDAWNHNLEGFSWFAELPEGATLLSSLDVVVAMAQCQDFWSDTQVFGIRQSVVSQLAYKKPEVIRHNPHMWEFLVYPPLLIMQFCSSHGYVPAFEEHHFEHLREGSYAHFQLLMHIHDKANSAVWTEMRRFVDHGPAMLDPDESSYSGALGQASDV